MQVRALTSVTAILAILMGRAEGSYAEDMLFTNLPSIQSGKYNVDPYIQAAMQLQRMGQQAAVEQLIGLAKSAAISRPTDDEQRTAILCRMLFTARPGSTFKRASFLGGAFFYGEGPSLDTTSYTNWPSEPIELVDGIPFAVVYGYTYEGYWDPHGAESYVRYCTTNCVWSDFHFAIKSESQKRRALQKVIASPKWRRQLDAHERLDLAEQIR